MLLVRHLAVIHARLDFEIPIRVLKLPVSFNKNEIPKYIHALYAK